MMAKVIYDLERIKGILPHRAPFLFVDNVTEFKIDKSIVAERLILADEPQFAGHFPGHPIMPGVLVVDALAQTAGLLWGFSRYEHWYAENGGNSPELPPQLFYLATANVKFVNPALPGDNLVMSAWSDKNFGSLFTYDVEAVAGRKVICKGSLTLAMVNGSIESKDSQ